MRNIHPKLEQKFLMKAKVYHFNYIQNKLMTVEHLVSICFKPGNQNHFWNAKPMGELHGFPNCMKHYIFPF